ncbi:serine/threonine protein kinase [Protomyces lactucae-debilis]|uniref:non-specific serine/threonine protein kinase n=1 Tax=Protomyces lactucae-debilis TaxID=2754530 RepID=A0A1Y2FNR7_PROLT|nr:serine/threonine protein kinase [Protomyces lactucae-debilis]ORY85603.1 serine/threonine protein kinase [Protomyces lactucae-debilis]
MASAQQEEILIKQGAEALAYRTLYNDKVALRKHRPKKTWRHPTLDKRLTRHRIRSEARILALCKERGMAVPELYHTNERTSDLWMEFVEGLSVRDLVIQATMAKDEHEEALKAMMARIGVAIASLHNENLVHGDLTTSNLMCRQPAGAEIDQVAAMLQGEVVMIDFGLGATSLNIEDKAVDLYVLERAFNSTHPNSESLFAAVLEAYSTHQVKSVDVLKRLAEVRLRGRKRSMLG